MPLGQRMQRLTGDEFFGDLAFERGTVGSMLGHGLLILQKPAQGGQIKDLILSTRRGALQLAGNYSTLIDSLVTPIPRARPQPNPFATPPSKTQEIRNGR